MFLAKCTLFIFVLLLALCFIPVPAFRQGIAPVLAVGVGSIGVVFLLIAVFSSVKRDQRLMELSIVGRHGLRKTDANSFTYFVDHPPLPDGSPNLKLLRFFWEYNGDEMETILPVDRVSLKIEKMARTTVEFCFRDEQNGKCGLRAMHTKNPNWWFAEENAKESGFNFALITMSPEDLRGEVFLNSEVRYF